MNVLGIRSHTLDRIKFILLTGGILLSVLSNTSQDQALKLAKSVDTAGNTAINQGVRFKKVESLADLNAEIAHSEKPVFLTFFADWDVAGVHMKKTTFVDRDVVALSQRFAVLEADISDYDDQDKELLKHFELLGPPVGLFFATDGTPLHAFKFHGYKSAADLKQTFEKILK